MVRSTMIIGLILFKPVMFYKIYAQINRHNLNRTKIHLQFNKPICPLANYSEQMKEI